MQDARGTSAKHGLSDAITRANLYTEVGADCALVEGPRSTYELQTIANHTTGFRAASISEGGLTPSHSYQQLKEMGFHLVCHVSKCSVVQTLLVPHTAGKANESHSFPHHKILLLQTLRT
jgi:2-methylisocitrate lyase-like PEP mutase family enzyme